MTTETNAERDWLLKCKQFASADDINKLIEKVNEYKSKLRYMTHHRDEQSERAQELEQEKEFFRNNFVELKAGDVITRKENARLREALEFYAGEDKWKPTITYTPEGDIHEGTPLFIEDNGHIARTALNTQKGTE